jgi:hypothetical protein
MQSIGQQQQPRPMCTDEWPAQDCQMPNICLAEHELNCVGARDVCERAKEVQV